MQPKIQADAVTGVLTPRQARFNELVREVSLWRATLSLWRDNVERYDRATEPLRRELHAAFGQWQLALEAASLQPGFSRAERVQLEGMLRDRAPGPEEPATDAEEQDEPPGEPDWQAQADAAAARREAAAADRRAARQHQRRSKAVQQASQSVRDVYRRLASALHPDRETDPRQRERKTAWMQQANQAYADGNLLALLELQLLAEQVNTSSPAAVDEPGLQHYIDVLQEQLAELKAETRRVETGFRAAAGLPPGTGLQPRKFDRVVSAESQALREDLQLLARQTRLLDDVEATKVWLRALRKAPRLS